MKINSIKSIFLLGALAGILTGCYTPQITYPTTTPTKPSTEKSEEVVVKDSKPETKEPVKNQETPKENPKVVQQTKETPKNNPPKPIKVNLPTVNREFRAAWIATVANINWPSKRGLSTEQQKAEALQLLDMLKDNNFNAVIFQARPSADALYDSPYEPWSIFLTGQIGKRPEPYYDPMEFWITEAHKRGIEFHVWINPYRAHHTNGGSVTSESIARKKSDLVVRLQNGMYWFDPAKKETQDYASMIVMDIVKRYDIDGVHFDDYFYPYASYNGGADFPDQSTYRDYLNQGGNLSKADWRRDNVNKFIERIYQEIKAEKNYVKFGISPFGIWKPGYPEGISGMSQYDELFADAKLWLNKGWLDYFTPQLYWPVDAPKQSFPKLLSWWESENTYKRHLWPGLNTVEIKTADKPSEIVRQIELTRQLVPNSAGVAHWSMAGLNSNMLYKLKSGPYKEKALIPKSPWLKPLISERPALFLSDENTNVQVNWSLKKPKNVSHWLLYKRYGDVWETEILDSNTTLQTLQKHKNGMKLDMVVIQAVDRLGNESDYEVKFVS